MLSVFIWFIPGVKAEASGALIGFWTLMITDYRRLTITSLTEKQQVKLKRAHHFFLTESLGFLQTGPFSCHLFIETYQLGSCTHPHIPAKPRLSAHSRLPAKVNGLLTQQTREEERGVTADPHPQISQAATPSQLA